MKPSLQPGIALVTRITVDRERTISFMGEAVASMPLRALIGDIEYTCRDLILEHADAGEDSVGVEVAVKHLAPTLPAMTVEITVRVNAVVGRKVTLDVVARDELDEIARGTHTRFVVDTPKTIERLKAQGRPARGHKCAERK